MSGSTQLDHPRGKEWLTNWDPENEETWDSRLAWRTLSITTFALTLAFSTWFLASAFAPILTNLGFVLTKGQLYWLAAMPGLAGGTLRLIWMFLPPIFGTRKLVTVTTALLLLPLAGWAIAIQNNETPYWVLMSLAFFAGIGGGAFSGFMPSTSYFFPRRLQGTALGVQAGVGNFGVSLVQFLTPLVVGVGMVGASEVFTDPATGDTKDVWYQNMLKSVPVIANFKQQMDIYSNQDTWWMTYLYVMTFGTFAGLSAQFGLLLKNLYGAGNTAIVETLSDGSTQLLIQGYAVPNPIKYVWLGPLIGAAARVVFSPLTDKMGGAIWTLISGIGLVATISYTITTLSPDPAAGAAALHTDFTHFLWGMLAIFLFAGIGNASTFKQMPMIFERRQAGGVIGWTAAIAAFGPFFFGAILAGSEPKFFFTLGVIYAVIGVIITWVRYARPGAPKPG
jgi:NNP family nitrate/nitrite transporter-like MFS transporter